MKLKNFSLICAIVGVACFFAMEVVTFICRGMLDDWFGSVLTVDWLSILLPVFGVTLLITAFACLFLSKTIKSSCSISTTAIALGISAVGTLGVFCFMNVLEMAALSNPSKAHPIEYPISIIAGMVSLLAFLALIVTYFLFRTKKRSIKGFILDISTAIVFCPTVFFAIGFLYCALFE